MSNSETGKLLKFMDLQTGTGAKGNWKKQPFVIETNAQYPKKICFEAWGDKADEILKYAIGTGITVHYNLESREYNNKWYTEAKAWKIEGGIRGNESVSTAKNTNTDEDDSDLPF